ncbi:MAG: Crp/Fnr family transcriptional regulator [bacterium]|nr:Crp/Fnr family transcriptional regulator [bacterium]
MDFDFSSSALKKYKKGEIVFREGQNAKDLYIIKSGIAEVLKQVNDQEIKLAELCEDDFFGEMAFFSDEPRSATVRALDDLEVYIVDEADFSSHMQNIPGWFSRMITVMAKRIKTLDERVVAQYKTGIEFSILNLLKFLAEQYGTHSGDQIALNKTFFSERIFNILGVVEDDVEKLFDEFISTGVLTIEPETEKIVIRDKILFERFLDFFQCMADNQDITEVKSQFPQLSDDTIKTFYYQYEAIHLKNLDKLSLLST